MASYYAISEYFLLVEQCTIVRLPRICLKINGFILCNLRVFLLLVQQCSFALCEYSQINALDL